MIKCIALYVTKVYTANVALKNPLSNHISDQIKLICKSTLSSPYEELEIIEYGNKGGRGTLLSAGYLRIRYNNAAYYSFVQTEVCCYQLSSMKQIGYTGILGCFV